VIARFRLHPKAFTRQRELHFHRLVALMLNLREGSTELELQGFFATVLGVVMTLAVPTRAAFAKARKCLSEQVFVYLNQEAVKPFRQAVGQQAEGALIRRTVPAGNPSAGRGDTRVSAVACESAAPAQKQRNAAGLHPAMARA